MTLKEWREQNRKTLAQVAAEAGTTDATISRIENGKQRPSVALARRLEAVTAIPAADLVMADLAA
jgi:transcriptional regulator with XRE-family HTH domain